MSASSKERQDVSVLTDLLQHSEIRGQLFSDEARDGLAAAVTESALLNRVTQHQQHSSDFRLGNTVGDVVVDDSFENNTKVQIELSKLLKMARDVHTEEYSEAVELDWPVFATPLLPTSEMWPLRKFSGSSDFSHDIKDALTQAIHSFCHYSLKYSKGCLAICDLQGLLDHSNTMTLFDPQCHSIQSEYKVIKDVY
ncbi:hypothetical protein EW145_g5763 [Phellinidium pouzarii]|uniref:Alpha-type protein kinase domain-containing protein n=1 Tax=Phellinidium pouzarii TaxID=167371 RepID=A0A4V3XC24_9AGAM|nr:hypothetical protein EW145_g5763 [Phellinidium pouzarii]